MRRRLFFAIISRPHNDFFVGRQSLTQFNNQTIFTQITNGLHGIGTKRLNNMKDIDIALKAMWQNTGTHREPVIS